MGFEPTRAQGSKDFKSFVSAIPPFRHPLIYKTLRIIMSQFVTRLTLGDYRITTFSLYISLDFQPYWDIITYYTGMALTVFLTVVKVLIKVKTAPGIGNAIVTADFRRLTKHALIFFNIAKS